MIQDLAPLSFDNTFHSDYTPQPADYILGIQKDQILIRTEEEEIYYPTFAEIKENPTEKEQDYTYLFSIGEHRFFFLPDFTLEGYHYEPMKFLRPAQPKYMAYAGLMAIQLVNWQKNRSFCGRCGTPMIPSTKERMMHCPSCGLTEYPKICPCVIVGIIHDGKILVSKYQGRVSSTYALIAGFAEAGESIEETVSREVFEETHLHVKHLQFYKSQPWPFSESLLFGFFCELDGGDHIIIQEDELSMAKFVTPDEITEPFNDYSLTNEMLHYFKKHYQGDLKEFYHQISKDVQGMD